MKELVEIQTRLNAPKDKYNSFGKYSYRSAEGILEAVKPLLKEQSCTLIVSDDVVMVGTRIYIKSTATITNSAGEKETTTAFAREEEQKKGMDGSQVTGAASSYARKYALNGLFCIDDNKDADALNTSKEYTQPVQQQNDQLQEAFELIKPNILSAPSRDYLRDLIKQNEALGEYPPFKSAINARWKQVN